MSYRDTSCLKRYTCFLKVADRINPESLAKKAPNKKEDTNRQEQKPKEYYEKLARFYLAYDQTRKAVGRSQGLVLELLVSSTTRKKSFWFPAKEPF